MGNKGSRNTGRTGTGCAILFGLVFALAGGAAAFLIGRMFLENLDTYRWDEAPCELLSCEINAKESDKNNPFTLEVNYRYTLDGTTYLGDRFKLEPLNSDNYTKLARKRRDLLNSGDGGINAWVDPDDRTSAILERGSLWLYALMMLFPLPFLAVGIGVIWFSVRSGKDKKSTSVSSSKSSSEMSPKAGRRVGIIVFGIFFLVGLGISWPLGVVPIRNAASAKSWTETPCKIIWSRVVTHEGDDGDTYSVDIFYEYEAGGELQRSNRYSFVSGSSSGRSSKQAIVKQYARRSQQVCYVDPNDPLEAVLKPKLGASIFLMLIPATFILIGGGGLAAMLLGGRKESKSSRLRGSNEVTRSVPEGDGFGDESSKTFRPGGKRLGAFFIALGIALFWNGITSVFVWQAIESFQRGSPDWFLTIFIIPFVLFGLAMVFAVVYTIAMQFNPKPILTLTPGTPALGQQLSVEWKIRGSAHRLRKLRLLLIGKEKATYRRGTNTSTDTKTFYRRALAEATHGLEMIQGEGRIELPNDLCHTLDLGSNEIEWSLKVEGEIAWWPDVGDEYKITVRPPQS